MKIQIKEYCIEKVDGRLLILDGQKVIDVSEQDALNLINKNLAIKINELDATERESTPQENSSVPSNTFENKMIDVVYKKRGRPAKR